MDFDILNDFKNVEMSYVSFLSKGYIARNRNIFEKINLTPFSKFILKSCIYGTPIFKMGSSGKKLLILSGVHGNELPPQLANLKLLNQLMNMDLNNTIYFMLKVLLKGFFTNLTNNVFIVHDIYYFNFIISMSSKIII